MTTPMQNEQSLAVRENNTVGHGSLLAIIDRAARDSSVDVSKMERLLAMAEQVHARTAKAEYDQALNAAQSEMRPISRDCHNPQTRSKYASYEAIDTAIRPIYTAHGFAMSFGSRAAAVPDHVIVTCRVSHRAGHTETVELDMPADGKGAKGNDVMTKTHATGSALSYGKRYIANLVWNLSFGEADDDGNAAGRTTPRPPQQSSPQAQPEPKQATKAAEVPKEATEATRTWMLKELGEAFPLETLHEYTEAKAILLPGESLGDWPLHKVPTSKEALRHLLSDIASFCQNGTAQPPSDAEPTVDEHEGKSRLDGVIERVSVKNGKKKNGEPWTMFGIKIREQWFNTFSPTLGEIAQRNQGGSVTMVYEETERGFNALDIIEGEVTP